MEVCPKKLIKPDEKLNKKGVNPVKFTPLEKAAVREYSSLTGFTGEDECVGCCFCAMICPDCCIEVYK